MSKYTYLTQYNARNNSGKRPGKITGITVHWWGDPNAGSTFESVINWFASPSNTVSSAHYVVEAGRVACMVAPGEIAWHAGNWNGNLQTIGIEMNPRCSAADMETLADLCYDLETVYGSLKYYRHKDWTATACPGAYSDKIGKLVNMVNARHGKEVPKSTPERYTIQRGDSLTAIAKKYGTTYRKLAQLNGIADPNTIYPGQVLKLR